MTLFTYLDYRYRTLSLELQTDYSIPKEAELKAAYSLIQTQRSFFKYLTIPVLFIKYIFINLHILKEPNAPSPKIITKETVVEAPAEYDNLN